MDAFGFINTQRLFGIGLITLFACFLAGCERDDSEPDNSAQVRVSRLYVSMSDVWPNDGVSNEYTNLMVFDPADSINANGNMLPPRGYNTLTTIGAGQGVAFNPFFGSVLQASRSPEPNQRVIHPTVSAAGVVQTGSSVQFFRDFIAQDVVNRPDTTLPPKALFNPRDIALQRLQPAGGGTGGTGGNSTYYLYVTDIQTNRINFYSNPKAVNAIEPRARFAAGEQPFGLHMTEDSLFVSYSTTTGNNPQRIELYLSPGTPFAEVAGSPVVNPEINGSFRLAIDASLRGLVYESSSDLLIVASFSNTSGGAIHFIEGAKQAFSAGASISPSRTISGAETTLINPTDVAIDITNDRRLLYVSDRGQTGAGGSILVFNLDGTGNIPPLGRYNFPAGNARIPEFIHLDARAGTGNSVIDTTGNIVPANGGIRR